MRRPASFAATFLVFFLVPALAHAQQRRSYSDYWQLTGSLTQTQLEKKAETLREELTAFEKQAAETRAQYDRVLSGLEYELATLEREREALMERIAQGRMQLRDLLSKQIGITGAPNHLKRRAAQRRLRDARNLLEETFGQMVTGIEEQNTLLEEEIANVEQSQQAAMRTLQQRRNRLERQLEQTIAQQARSVTDKRTVFIDYISQPEQDAFLMPRKIQHLNAKRRGVERLRAALLAAEESHYLNTPQPIVEQMLEEERQKDLQEHLKLLERDIIESLGSSTAPEELKKLYLERFILEGERQ